MTQSPTLIGESVPRTGLDSKVRGAADYTADLKRPGMLYGRILRSPHPHARVRRIDTSKALALPGVHAVLTYQDVPDVRIDADLLPLDQTLRFVGDEVAVVAAERADFAPILDAFVAEDGGQCGFCVPGFAVATYAALKHDATLDELALRWELVGHVCRCNAYDRIAAAASAAATRASRQ